MIIAHRNRGKRRFYGFIAFILLVFQTTAFVYQPKPAEAADNGLGTKPYMGWSSYSQQVIHSPASWLTAENIIAQSDAMHEKLQSHGYNYINVDAGWNGGMDDYGRPTPSATVFPNGMQEVIDHVHANGQKFGLYIIPGLGQEAYDQNLPIYGTECTMRDIVAQPLQQANYWGFGYKIDFSKPCAQLYIDSVADKFGEWGVDFIKLDSVMPGSGRYDLSIDTRDNVAAWSKALAKHHIWLELSWALDINYADTWKEYANGWRVHWDIECYCNTLTKWDNISRLFPTAAQWWRHAGPGGWNDFDSLNIGNGTIDGLTQEERRTAMTFFAVSAVPLYSGNDLTDLDDYGLQLLTNDEVIAVDQAGHPARPLSTDTNQQVWYTNNGDGTYTVGLFNLDNSAATVNVNWRDIGIDGPASVRDLWSHSELGAYKSGYRATDLPAHGSRLFKVTVLNGTSFVNDDDVGIQYSGAWERNIGSQFPGSEQSLLINVSDSKAVNSTLNPASAQFDKKAEAQADVAVALTLNGNTLNGIARGGASLAEGTDYSVSGNTVTIKKAYLASLPNGNSNLIFSFSGGAGQTLIVMVSDTTIRDSSVLPAVLDFDKGDRNQGDETTSIAFNGNELVSIDYGGSPLSEGDQYTRLGNAVMFKKAFLAALPIGTSEFSFAFSGGGAQSVTLVVNDSSVGGSFSLNDDDPAIVYAGTWNSNTNRGLGDYKDDIHWSETAGDSFQYTFNGTGIELITELDSSQGKIDIYVDEVLQKTVNTNNSSRSTHHAVFNVAGLQPGQHTLKAVKRAWEDGGGFFMLLDQLRVTLPDLVSPAALSFDKNASSSDDIRAAVTSGYEISGVTNGGTALQEGTDYTAAGGMLTIKKAYLTAQSVDMARLLVSFAGGAEQQLAIDVTDSAAVNSTITPAMAGFDKNESAQADAVTAMTLDGNQLIRIVNVGAVLSAGTDYTVSGSDVTIKKTYLAGLPLGITKLKFVFDHGKAQNFAIDIRDTTAPNSSIIPKVISFDKTKVAQSDVSTAVTLNGNSLVSITNGGTVLVAGSDYTFSGNQVSFNPLYLGGLPAGMNNLTMTFSAGTPVTIPIAVTESLRGRYVDVNDDDAGILYAGTWNPNTNRGLGDYKDDIHWSETAGDSFSYTFKGTGIELITELDASQGAMDIYLDGAFAQTVDTYIDTTRTTHRTVYAVAGLSEGEHTIKAVKKSGQFMLLDQLRYKITDMIGPDTASFDKSNAHQADVTTNLAFDARNLVGISNGAISLRPGKDYTVSGNTVRIKKSYLAMQPAGITSLKFSILGDYLDDVHAAANNGDAFGYTFKGTGVDIIAPIDPTQGDMDVYVDGVFRKRVSLHGESRLSRQTVFTVSGLKNGTHTIKGVKKGGTTIILDGLRFDVPAVRSKQQL